MPEHNENYEKFDWHLEIAKMKVNFQMLKEFMIITAERYPLYAKQYKAYFDALVSAGFTPEQAIELIKSHGWSPKD